MSILDLQRLETAQENADGFAVVSSISSHCF